MPTPHVAFDVNAGDELQQGSSEKCAAPGCGNPLPPPLVGRRLLPASPHAYADYDEEFGVAVAIVIPFENANGLDDVIERRIGLEEATALAQYLMTTVNLIEKLDAAIERLDEAQEFNNALLFGAD